MWNFRYGSYGQKGELIKVFKSREDAFNYVEKFVKEKLNYNSYYTRTNVINDQKFIIDFGSHTKFITIDKREE